MKILVLGGSGLIGDHFITNSKAHDITTTYNNNKINFPNVISKKINLPENWSGLEELILNQKPDIVLNSIANSNADFCEMNREDTFNLHVNITKKITDVCSKINSKIIFLSTDYVFDGKSNNKYKETDETNPINYYGKTKVEAENIVLKSSKKNAVLRTAVIYGWHKSSKFTNWILSSLNQGKIVDPFIDQYNTPTLVDDLVKSIINIIEMNVSGLFHAVGNTCVNRYEFALLLAEKFQLEKKLVESVTSKEKKQSAPRPFRTCLDASKLEKILNFKFSSLDDGVSFIVNQSKSEKVFD